MAIRSREILKNYFRQGKRPTEEHFFDLIDSSLNTLDDGLSGGPQIGIGLAPVSDDGVIISAHRKAGDTDAIWKMAIDTKNGDLQVKKCKGTYSDNQNEQKIITLKYDESVDETQSKISIDSDIDFKGNVSFSGRKGNYCERSVLADSNWHDVFDESIALQEGCRMFEIVAGCGKKGSGKYALLHAVVMHCYGNKPRKQVTQSYYGDFRNKLVLRWAKMGDRFTRKLQIRTRSNYGEGVVINFHITNLWDNPAMK